jgi:hypothetical protein
MTTTTSQTNDAPLPSSNNAEVSASSVAIWLAIQLLAIGLILARVRLWIRGGDDADALSMTVIAQIVGASIFAPVLMRNIRTAICVTLGMLPFIQIAGIIAAADTRQIAATAAAVMLWVISLGMAIATSRAMIVRAMIHAIANCISVGGVIVFYLRAEFAGQSSGADFACFGPIASAVTLARRDRSTADVARAWIALAIVALVFFAIAILNRLVFVARARRA